MTACVGPPIPGCRAQRWSSCSAKCGSCSSTSPRRHDGVQRHARVSSCAACCQCPHKLASWGRPPRVVPAQASSLPPLCPADGVPRPPTAPAIALAAGGSSGCSQCGARCLQAVGAGAAGAVQGGRHMGRCSGNSMWSCCRWWWARLQPASGLCSRTGSMGGAQGTGTLAAALMLGLSQPSHLPTHTYHRRWRPRLWRWRSRCCS